MRNPLKVLGVSSLYIKLTFLEIKNTEIDMNQWV